jgi:cytochrome c biogenesis protein CcdA/thiol-disulfide isomerase/thioredoxin
MTLLILSYLGGVLTILSPCVLPVLPFVFARADRPFRSSTLPMLLGMALTFAGVATLAAVGGGWVVRASDYGRIVALILLGIFGLMLLLPRVADHIMQPLVAAGNRWSQPTPTGERRDSVLAALVLGAAIGFLWSPCAGPILGLILTGAALQGANARTSLLLLTYALGAATSLALALLFGGRVFAALKRSLGFGEWIRRVLGVAVLAAVALIALGWDTGFLTRLSLRGTERLEQGVMNVLRAGDQKASGGNQAADELTASTSSEGKFPDLAGAVGWINSPALTPQALRGKVVLVDFWTYSCINCLRSLPYVRAWAAKYQSHGLVVIGVHTPEFAFEKSFDNVRRAVRDLNIHYPVALDNNYAVWSAFANRYWPADYLIDAKGEIRAHVFGEGDYGRSERLIQALLREAGFAGVPTDLVNPQSEGAQAAADMEDVHSHETYVGYDKAENFASPENIARDQPQTYSLPAALRLNQWGLSGQWMVQGEKAVLLSPTGRIGFEFHARDLHLVLGPSADGKPIHFRVLFDGRAPGANHGADTDAQGNGVIGEQRLYQLIRQGGDIEDRRFTIEFEDAGAQAYSFTFG